MPLTFGLGERTLPTHGLQVLVIDVSLSLLEKDNCIAFYDAAQDNTLFAGQLEYQFEIHRLIQAENSN